MHVHFLDPYQKRRSPIHDLDPRVKFVLAVAFIFTTALTPQRAWPVYILLLALVISVEILSELGVFFVLKRAALALPFVMAALPVIFTMPGQALFVLDVGSWQMAASLNGMARFISVALKSWISVQAAIVLSASTPFPELLVAMRAVGIPRLLVAVFGLMWRYMFVLADEAMRLMRARAARSGQLVEAAAHTGGSLTWRARVTGGMAGNLFLRAFERSDRIYMAMLARGYDGEVRSSPLTALKGSHRLVLAAGIGLLTVILIFSVLLYA